MLTASSLLNVSPSDIVTFGNNCHLVGPSIRADLRDTFVVGICRLCSIVEDLVYSPSSRLNSSTKIMHLGISNVLRGLFTFEFGDKKGEATDSRSDDHSYIRGNIADRGPCPGLNALANQGYLYVSATSPL
jgi:hypothetical protein